MSILSMVEAKLPPGFRFHPRDDELICDYLSHRATVTVAATTIDGAGFHGFPFMVDVDLNNCEPWDLPEVACIRGKEWYFFSLKDKKYATGQRTNRATRSGYWKATGKDRHVLRKGALVGMRKTLVFYQGRAPKGKKTHWVMHEFRMECSSHSPNSSSSFKKDWVLCRVFYKRRSLSAKVRMEACDEDASSSSLPPLMDSQLTSYDQASISHEELEQVPCFSSLSASQAAANVSSSSSSLNTSPYDKKVLKVVLSKLEENQQINGGCCFTDSGILIPSLWNPFGGF